MSGRVHTKEFKLRIVRQLASGEKRPVQVCREHTLAPVWFRVGATNTISAEKPRLIPKSSRKHHP